MGLTDERLREMREDATKATMVEGRWGAHGMCLLAGEPGATADTAEHVADFYTRDQRGKRRTFDLDHTVNFQPRIAIALIDELLLLREAARTAHAALALAAQA